MKKAPFDVFFYHIDEPYAQKHLQDLNSKVLNVREIKGHIGIQEVLQEMAKLSTEDYFFTVDSDNIVRSSFDWNVPGLKTGDERVHVWRCYNPLTGLSYGHGAIKLWPKTLILENTLDIFVDYTSEITFKGFCIQEEVASDLCYFDSVYGIWSQAYKECLKLSSDSTRYLNSEVDPKLVEHLEAWANEMNNMPNGIYSLHGARRGILYGMEIRGKKAAVKAALSLSKREFEAIEDVQNEVHSLGLEIKKLNLLKIKSLSNS